MPPPAATSTGAPPRPPMDPRLRARRIAVRRDEGRRRLRRLLVVLGAVAVAAAGWGATRSPLLDVDRILVEGNLETPWGAVVAASGVERGQAMTDVDPRAAEAAVAALPWVAEAAVAREWPGTVRITVVERVAVAAAPARGGGWAMLDGAGHVLAHAGEAPPGLPAVRGLAAAGEPGTVLDDDAAAGTLELAARLGAALPGALRSLLPDEREVVVGEVVVQVHDGALEVAVPGPAPGQVVTAVVGPPTELAAKVQALVTVLEQADLHAVARVDVRVPGAPVLTRAGPGG